MLATDNENLKNNCSSLHVISIFPFHSLVTIMYSTNVTEVYITFIHHSGKSIVSERSRDHSINYKWMQASDKV